MGGRINELYIPYFKNLTSAIERNIVIIGDKIWNGYEECFKNPLEVEPSIELIKKEFPQVEFYETEHINGAELWNQGLEILKDYDTVLIWAADVFLTKKDWKTLIDFIKNTNYECYKLNHPKCVISYYYDFEHGAKSNLEYDAIAIDPRKRFSGILDFGGKTYTIEWDNFIMHHFRGWKGFQSDKDWIEGKIPSPSGVYSYQIVEKYGNNGKWYICPREIKDLFKKC